MKWNNVKSELMPFPMHKPRVIDPLPQSLQIKVSFLMIRLLIVLAQQH